MISELITRWAGQEMHEFVTAGRGVPCIFTATCGVSIFYRAPEGNSDDIGLHYR